MSETFYFRHGYCKNILYLGINYCVGSYKVKTNEALDKMPPPKDRLAAMQKTAGDDDDFGVPMDEDMEGPLKDFFKDVEEIRTNCDKIDTKITDVKKLQSEILSSPAVDPKMQASMDDYMAEIKKIANSVRSK